MATRSLGILAALFLATAAAPATAQNARYGVHTYYLSSYLAEKSRELGTGFVRIEIDWNTLQPDSPDQWNDALLRSWLDAARTQHLKLFATLMNTPSWAGPCMHCMPDDVWSWYEFVRRVVSQMRTAYPDIEIVFGVWNEPNLSGPNGFFTGTDKDYAVLFRYASMARDAANPRARFAAPDLSVGGFGPLAFFESALTQIGSALHDTDVVTFHWYPGQGALEDWVAAIRDRAAKHEIWLTETGNNTCSDLDQRATIDYVINMFDFKNPTPLWTKVFVYYLWDAYTNCAANIVRVDGSNRPAFIDYRNRASGVAAPQHGITLRAANGKFVSASDGANARVAADAVSAGIRETFDLIDLNGGPLVDGDKVALQAASGLYLQVDPAVSTVVAGGAAPREWETFTVVALRTTAGSIQSGDAIALQTDQGVFLTADIGGSEALAADRRAIGPWETFEIVTRGSDPLVTKP